MRDAATTRWSVRIAGGLFVIGGVATVALFAATVAHASGLDDAPTTEIACVVELPADVASGDVVAEVASCPEEPLADATQDTGTPSDVAGEVTPTPADEAASPATDDSVADLSSTPEASPEATSESTTPADEPDWTDAADWSEVSDAPASTESTVTTEPEALPTVVVVPDEPVAAELESDWDEAPTWTPPADADAPVADAPVADTEPAVETQTVPELPAEVSSGTGTTDATPSESTAGTAVEPAEAVDDPSVAGGEGGAEVGTDVAVSAVVQDAPAAPATEPEAAPVADTAPAPAPEPVPVTEAGSTEVADAVVEVAAAPETAGTEAAAPAEAEAQPAVVPVGVDTSAGGATAAQGPTDSGLALTPADVDALKSVDPQNLPSAGTGPFTPPPPCSGVELLAGGSAGTADGRGPIYLGYDEQGNLRAVYADGTPVPGGGASGSPRAPSHLPDPFGGPLPAVPTAPGPVACGSSGPTSGHGHQLTSDAVVPSNVSVTGPRAATLEGVLHTPREHANGVDDHPG